MFGWSPATRQNGDNLNGDTAVITVTDWVKTGKKQQVKMATMRVYTLADWKKLFRNYYIAHPIFQIHHAHWWFPPSTCTRLVLANWKLINYHEIPLDMTELSSYSWENRNLIVFFCYAVLVWSLRHWSYRWHQMALQRLPRRDVDRLLRWMRCKVCGFISLCLDDGFIGCMPLHLFSAYEYTTSTEQCTFYQMSGKICIDRVPRSVSLIS